MFPIHDTIPSRSVPLAFWALLLTNGAVFACELSLSDAQLEDAFYGLGVVPARYAQEGSLYVLPFLTHIFLHAGWLHVLGNLWMLWIFGDNVEDRMGAARFLAFYVFCGVAAGVTQAVLTPNSTVPSVGASGAIAGVMGAYLVLFPRSTIVTLIPILFYPLFVQIPAVVYLVLWFGLELGSGALSLGAPDDAGGIAFWAHVGGFLAGLISHRLFLAPHAPRRAFAADECVLEECWRRTRRGY